MTAGENALFADKVVGTIKWVKARLRDRGSGKRLPGPCIALMKIWEANHKPSGGGRRDRSGSSQSLGSIAQQEKDKKPKDIRSTFGLGPKQQKVPMNW